MGFIRANDNNNDLAAHIAAPDPHPQYLTQQDGDARYRSLAALTDADIPSTIARDSEVAAAIAAHTQNLLNQSPMNAGAFDANNWKPNAVGDINNTHKSAINYIYISGLNGQLTNFPQGALHGYLIQIEGNTESTVKTQFFLNSISLYGVPFQIFWRSTNGLWSEWLQIPITSLSNIFSAIQNFSAGISIGQNGTLIKKILSQEFTIDPPAVASQGATPINLTITGATVGDVVYIAPIGTDIINTSIWPFEWPAVVSSANNVVLLLRNDWSGTIDLAPLKIRVVVMGF